MPISLAEATARFGHLTPRNVSPMPTRPFDNADVLSMLEVSRGVAHCFTGLAPLFHTPEGSICRTLSEKILFYDAPWRERANNLQGGALWSRNSRSRDENALIDRFLGSVTHHRPYAELMRTPTAHALIEAYCKRVCSAMLRSSSSLDSVDPVLFVGVSDWAILSGWEVGKTLLAARAYATWIHNEAQARGLAIPAEAIPHSLAHPCSPSLTARQSRRSGVVEGELRRKWR